MVDKKLSVLAQIVAKSGMEDKVKEEALALAEPTRSEKGCINYDIHQARESKNLFIIYENWTSKEALDEHLAKPYLQQFLQKQDELLDEPVKLVLMEMITEPAS